MNIFKSCVSFLLCHNLVLCFVKGEWWTRKSTSSKEKLELLLELSKGTPDGILTLHW